MIREPRVNIACMFDHVVVAFACQNDADADILYGWLKAAIERGAKIELSTKEPSPSQVNSAPPADAGSRSKA